MGEVEKKVEKGKEGKGVEKVEKKVEKGKEGKGVDGGDCCYKTVQGGVVKKAYCIECKCIDPKNKGEPPASCGLLEYKGDGHCDDDNNNKGCSYDGGDCCASTVTGGKVKTDYCKQ